MSSSCCRCRRALPARDSTRRDGFKIEERNGETVSACGSWNGVSMAGKACACVCLHCMPVLEKIHHDYTTVTARLMEEVVNLKTRGSSPLQHPNADSGTTDMREDVCARLLGLVRIVEEDLLLRDSGSDESTSSLRTPPRENWRNFGSVGSCADPGVPSEEPFASPKEFSRAWQSASRLPLTSESSFIEADYTSPRKTDAEVERKTEARAAPGEARWKYVKTTMDRMEIEIHSIKHLLQDTLTPFCMPALAEREKEPTLVKSLE